jgi:hypothetical protein
LVVSASGALGERPLEAAVAPAAETRAEPVAVTPVTPAAMRPPVPRIDPDDVPF